MEASPFEVALGRGRTSLASGSTGGAAKRWAIAQCAIAAGVAWWFAARRRRPPGARSSRRWPPWSRLGTSYGQRLRRVAEVTVGVALGVFGADLLVRLIGTGGWQIDLIVGAGDDHRDPARQRAGVRHPGGRAVDRRHDSAARPRRRRWTRWTDALIGGGVALVAATVVPAAPLRRPREQAAQVVRKIRDLLHGRQRGDGRRRRRPRAGAAGRGAGDRPPDPRAPGRRRRGAVGGRVVAVPGPARPRAAQDGRAGRAARPGPAQHPRPGPADGGRGLPAPAGAALLLDPDRRARRRPSRWSRPSWSQTGWPRRAQPALLAVGHGVR